ncbi:MAG: T9SS type A sorting domain-containing protein [Bacteroidia bacterium]|nr:T9SS type A sorting domain-containing protein [Bacteroidia bacterium]
MKKLYTLALSFVTTIGFIHAQAPCSGGRYAFDTFTTVTTSSVAYGANTSFSGSNTTLVMDIYQPDGDTATNRPLIIWAHGGSFIGGTRTDADMVALSQAFAKKGFVCASIEYRLGFFPFDSANAIKAVLRAVQDMKASIRYFYKDKQTSNNYRIDTNNIFIGGSSAGAITALQTAYLDKSCEINYYLSPTTLSTMGGMEGYSGNQCYSSNIRGVINLCGALGRYGWIEPGDVPFCSMHGTIDGTVKYNRGMVNPGTPLMLLDGSRMLKEQANAIGVNNPFYTWYGQDHVPYASNSAYMDSTINFIRDFLVSTMGCTVTPLLPENTPAQTATLYSYSTCTTNVTMPCAPVGVKELTMHNTISTVYPNPSNSDVFIEFINISTTHFIELLDITGKSIIKETTNEHTFKISRAEIADGMYILKVTDKSGETATQKLIFQ